MSVIVGMEMPKVCIQGDWLGNCPMDRTLCAQRFAPKGMAWGQISEEQQDKLPDWCPLRPLPEKHGRLGDIDAIMEEIKNSRIFKGDSLIALMDIVDGATTIVEAEGE